MKNTFFRKPLVVAITFLVAATACTKQGDVLPAKLNSEDGKSSVNKLLSSYTIDFEGISSTYMAGNTSYGDNCYSTWGGTQIAPYVHTPTNLRFAIKGAGGSSPVEFWDGGFVVSDWNYKANIPGTSGDWWYSYLNQCSVYSGTSGAKNGGADGSSNFAVMFGYVDDYNYTYATRPTLDFTSGSGEISGMKVCLSSYTYGVIMNGNSFGSIGSGTPLSAVQGGNGFLTLQAYGFNGSTPTNGGLPVEIDLARYLGGSAVAGPLTSGLISIYLL
ncbi:DUF4465 domain-containing protein [Chitinophaga sedimenti]|uniref:DUF4465 domain-containing protein n=1 Tax=Chitinophaga sedimenti TaxID=2033606 RepID=UPI00200496DA|nr:DUF4465 domain-containing protein [Chitinophaga sedimenti]MCK7555775.1 DUF4465 domain-containing protein [Chitinophaga sedimenti]